MTVRTGASDSGCTEHMLSIPKFNHPSKLSFAMAGSCSGADQVIALRVFETEIMILQPVTDDRSALYRAAKGFHASFEELMVHSQGPCGGLNFARRLAC